MALTSRPSARPELGTLLVLRLGLALGPGLSCSDGTGIAHVGEVQMFVVDDADGRHHAGYALNSASGEVLALSLPARQSVEPGSFIRAFGRLAPPTKQTGRIDTITTDGTLVVERIEILQRPAGATAVVQQPLLVNQPKTIKAAIILLNFAQVTPQSFTLETAKTRLETVRSYYEEISYGIWNIEGDAFGPFQIPKPANCNLDTIASAGRQVAKAQGIAIDTYQHLAFALPANSASGLNCACGLASVGRSPALPDPRIEGNSLYTCTDPNAFAHEMGHGFGLDHANTASCGGQAYKKDPYTACQVEEYGNHFNTMGNGLGHMNGFQKATMKWTDKCNVVQVARDGTFDLFAIQSRTDSIQTLQIKNGDTRDNNPLFYYVAYRNPELAKFNADPEKLAGVQIDVAKDFRAPNGDSRPLLLDLAAVAPGKFTDPRLTVGRTFTDPNGLQITFVAESREKAVIQVKFPGGGTGESLCADGTTPPASTGVDGGSGGNDAGRATDAAPPDSLNPTATDSRADTPNAVDAGGTGGKDAATTAADAPRTVGADGAPAAAPTGRKDAAPPSPTVNGSSTVTGGCACQTSGPGGASLAGVLLPIFPVLAWLAVIRRRR